MWMWRPTLFLELVLMVNGPSADVSLMDAVLSTRLLVPMRRPREGRHDLFSFRHAARRRL